MNCKHIFCTLFFCFSTVVIAQKYKNTSTNSISKEWQGITFTSDKTLQENIAQSASFSIMASILENESLTTQLYSQEMITVFVADNISFMSLEEDARKVLLADDTRVSRLVKFLTIPGRVDKNSIEKAISVAGGTAYFLTLEGEKLAVTKKEETIVISDIKGNSAVIKETDFYHKNGFFHMVEGIAFDTADSQ